MTDASTFRESLNHIEGSAGGEGADTKKEVRSYLLDSLSDGLYGLTFTPEIAIQSPHKVGFNVSFQGRKALETPTQETLRQGDAIVG